jgi:predicted metalloprotease with PDZ domain
MKIRILVTMLAATVLLAGTAEAQRATVFRYGQPRAWLGFQYSVDTRGTTAVIAVEEVVADAPAQRAGLVVGDTLLSVNGIRASEELLASLGSTLVPGDTVRLRLRRASREREVTVIAAERPAQYATFGASGMFLDADTIRSRIRILVDSAFTSMDTLPRAYFVNPSGRIRFDSLTFRTFGDSMFIRLDTLLGNRFSMRHFSPESLRFAMDSLYFRSLVPLRGVQIRTMPGTQALIFRDSLMRLGSYGLTMYGQTVIAGAEMILMDDDLGEFFGASAGVLITRVHEGTPAARADLHAGDVILRADGTDVDSVDDVRRAIVRAPAGRAVEIEVLRRRNRVTVLLNRD